MTAPARTSQRDRLPTLNKKYLALRGEIRLEVAQFRYPVHLINQMIAVRNEIVEIQNSLSNPRKGGATVQ